MANCWCDMECGKENISLKAPQLWKHKTTAVCWLLNIIIIIIIIIIIAFKGAIRDFLQSPHSAMNCLQHVRSSGRGAIVCKSRATHRALITCKCHVTCHLVRRDSSAIKFDRVEIAFIWALFYWLNHQTDEHIPATCRCIYWMDLLLDLLWKWYMLPVWEVAVQICHLTQSQYTDSRPLGKPVLALTL